jgi:hypothetical protein
MDPLPVGGSVGGSGGTLAGLKAMDPLPVGGSVGGSGGTLAGLKAISTARKLVGGTVGGSGGTLAGLAKAEAALETRITASDATANLIDTRIGGRSP